MKASPLTAEERAAQRTNMDAFKHFSRLLSLPFIDPERERIANESLIADLVGDDPIPVPSSTIDPKVGDLLWKYLDLVRVPHNFQSIETMTRHYPWRGRISQSTHIEHCYYLLAHETYIFEERLKNFLNAIAICAAEQDCLIPLKQVTKDLLKMHKAAFGSIVAARGQHVHQQAYVPREIRRIGLLEIQMIANSDAPFAFFHRLAVRAAKKKWTTAARDARRAAELLIAQALSETKSVWAKAVEGQLQTAKG